MGHLIKKGRKLVFSLALAGVLGMGSGCSSLTYQDITSALQSSSGEEPGDSDSFSANLFGTAQETTAPEDSGKTNEFNAEVVASVTARADSNYYYNLLSEPEKKNYISVAAALQEQLDSVKLEETDADVASKIYSCVLMDYPEYFWCDASYKYYESAIRQEIEIIPQYNCGVEERQQRQAAVENVVSQIVAQAPSTEDHYEEIKYVYEYIINNTDYQLDAPENQNIFSVFNNHASVCAGYAKAMQYLLNRMGIYCICVSGTTDKGELHAWNIVQCGGEYCYVDATWGDPIYMESVQGETPVQDTISYDYLCCSQETMQRTHIADSTFTLPACTTTDYEYYRRSGRFFDSADENQLRELMESDIAQRGERTDMQFASGELYLQAVAICEGSLFDEAAQYLGQYYGLSSVSYYRQNEDDTWRITVWWNYS
ncbi:MAG: transglutaminase domain-containing protein [Lachnospiraceae bacterium]|nr:transglutaminase domain-containing protein [Lachnospiraceae bacterium]